MPADYVTMAQMNGLIPATFLVQALDDDQDGAADLTAWADVLAQAQRQIDGPLSVRFAVPFSNPLPPVVAEAAPVFAAELLYKRRGIADEQNPWLSQANKLRAKLEQIAKGDVPLLPTLVRAATAVGVVAGKSKLSTTKAAV
jgi:phage gp36-like protein